MLFATAVTGTVLHPPPGRRQRRGRGRSQGRRGRVRGGLRQGVRCRGRGRGGGTFGVRWCFCVCVCVDHSSGVNSQKFLCLVWLHDTSYVLRWDSEVMSFGGKRVPPVDAVVRVEEFSLNRFCL